MNKKTIKSRKNYLFLAFILTIAFVLLGGCTQTSVKTPAQQQGQQTLVVNTNNPPVQQTPNQTQNPTTKTTPLQQTSASSTQTYQVDIKGFSFSSPTLTISKGDTVTWTNLDSAPHTVSGGTELDSPSLGQGSSYSHTFTATGTYNYHCSIHTSMRGTIIVQ